MNLSANFDTAVQLLESGRTAEALKMGQQLLKAHSKSDLLLQFCGTCAVNMSELKLAGKYYSKLVKYHPQTASYWSDLAFIYYSSQDFKRARQAYGRAARLEPLNPEPLHGNALCLVAMKDLDGAAAQFSRALKLAPNHPGALKGLANVRQQQLRPLEAMSCLRQLAQVGVNLNADFWVDFAEAAYKIADIPEAVRALKITQKMDYSDAELDARIGFLYGQTGHLEEAISIVKQVINQAPDNPDYLNDAADIYTSAGDHDAAVKAYRKIISLRPEIGKTYHNISQLVKFSEDSPEDMDLLVTMEQALNDETSDPALVHFALGKAYSDLKDSNKAFHHFTVGNNLRKLERPYTLKSDIKQVKRQKQLFPRGSIDTTQVPVPKDKLSPIFILGMPRSGTTLVEQIIGAHPEVTPCGELMLLNYILSSKTSGDETEIPAQTWRDIGDTYRTQVAGLAEGQNRITDKLPHNFFNVGTIWSAMPDARIILLKRNPLSIGLSCYQACFSAGLDFSHDLTLIGGFYRLFSDLCDHWREVAPDRLYTVEYEELVADIDVNIEKLLDFCDLEWHEDCARYFEKHRRIVTASFNQANKPIYKSSVEKWRQYETHLQPLIEALEERAPAGI